MKLSVLERLLVQGLLPEKGSFTNIKLMRLAMETLSFDEAENKALGFRQEGEQTIWNDGAVGEKEVIIGEVVSNMVKKALKELDEKEELKPEQFTLYEKFVEAGK